MTAKVNLYAYSWHQHLGLSGPRWGITRLYAASGVLTIILSVSPSVHREFTIESIQISAMLKKNTKTHVNVVLVYMCPSLCIYSTMCPSGVTLFYNVNVVLVGLSPDLQQDGRPDSHIDPPIHSQHWHRRQQL